MLPPTLKYRSNNRSLPIFLLLLPSVLLGYGVENNAGLRWAQWTGSTTIRIEVGPGLGAFKGKAIRIGLMGHGATLRNVTLVLSALKALLPKS